MDRNQYQPYQPYMQVPPMKKNAAYYREKARAILKPCYWYAVLAAFLAALLGGLSVGGSIFLGSDSTEEEVEAIPVEELINIYRADGISGIFEAYPILPLVLSAFVVLLVFSVLFSLFVSAPVMIGYQRYNLDVVDGQGKDVSVLFRYFKQGYGKTIGIRVLYHLLTTACSLPLLAVTVVLVWSNRGAIVRLMLEQADRNDTMALLGMLGVIALVSIATCLLLLWVEYRYTFSFMILAEYPELRVTDAFRNSASLMRGNKWRLFCLHISFLGWMLLAAIVTLGIGMFFLTPYIEAANAAFYDDIANRAAARETEFPSLNPDDYSPTDARW